MPQRVKRGAARDSGRLQPQRSPPHPRRLCPALLYLRREKRSTSWWSAGRNGAVRTEQKRGERSGKRSIGGSYNSITAGMLGDHSHSMTPAQFSCSVYRATWIQRGHGDNVMPAILTLGSTVMQERNSTVIQERSGAGSISNNCR